MGWKSMYTGFGSKDSKAIKEFLLNEWNRDKKFEALDYSRKGNVVYMAVKHLDTNEVFATVTLISFENGEFFWKDMDETCGPGQVECPQRILKLLTPTEYEYAKNWRKKCWEFHEKNCTGAKKYQHGDILIFPREVTFTDGFKGNQFILYKRGRSSLFAPFTGQTNMKGVYPIYRITRWKDSEPTITGHLA